jgi:uncharacterized membrane protein YbaN (DUF454 family)
MDHPPGVRTGWRRVALVGLGCGLVGLAYLGVLLPGLPATPFLLAASYCFVRSSPRLHRWLRRSPVFGRLIHDWEVHRGIRRPVKVFAVCLVVTAVTASVVFSSLPAWAKGVIMGLAAVGVTVILCLPTVGSDRPDPRTVIGDADKGRKPAGREEHNHQD